MVGAAKVGATADGGMERSEVSLGAAADNAEGSAKTRGARDEAGRWVVVDLIVVGDFIAVGDLMVAGDLTMVGDLIVAGDLVVVAAVEEAADVGALEMGVLC